MRLTKAEKEAVSAALNEILAGDPEDFASSIGKNAYEGEKLFALLQSALDKL